jgi:hypothetical protein
VFGVSPLSAVRCVSCGRVGATWVGRLGGREDDFVDLAADPKRKWTTGLPLLPDTSTPAIFIGPRVPWGGGGSGREWWLRQKCPERRRLIPLPRLPAVPQRHSEVYSVRPRVCRALTNHKKAGVPTRAAPLRGGEGATAVSGHPATVQVLGRPTIPPLLGGRPFVSLLPSGCRGRGNGSVTAAARDNVAGVACEIAKPAVPSATAGEALPVTCGARYDAA